MLSEEKREFMMANTLPHKFQEYADFLFVMTGTLAKYDAIDFESMYGITHSQRDMDTLTTWIEGSLKRMRRTLEEMLDASSIGSHWFETIAGLAVLYVTEANEAKGREQLDGKIVKGEHYVSPLVAIIDYLEEEFEYEEV